MYKFITNFETTDEDVVLLNWWQQILVFISKLL